jgi:hypothetical protein
MPFKLRSGIRHRVPRQNYHVMNWRDYETGQRLSLPDATAGRYMPMADPDLQWAAPGETAARYRVKNNLPGTPDFCPLVHRIKALEGFVGLDLPAQAKDIVAAVRRDLLARAAAFCSSRIQTDARSWAACVATTTQSKEKPV